MSSMKIDISKMKKNLEITRESANDSGEKLDELIIELKKLDVIA